LQGSVVVEINGKIKGELLENETINDIASLEDNVVVPAGKNFTVNGDIVKDNLTHNNVYVNGTINFQKEVALTGVNIHFQGSCCNIAEIQGDGTLIFYSSSSGSSVEKCKGQLGISVKNNTSISISKSEIGWFGMEEQKTFLDISDSTVLGNLVLTKVQGLTVNKSTFMGYVTITGGNPEFEECEFADYVDICNRNEAKFTECVFGFALEFYDSEEVTGVPKWSEDSNIQPSFSGNSFVGRMGPVFLDPIRPFSSINFGTNYYGDKEPIITSDTCWLGSGVQPGWFLTRSVPVNRYHFTVNSSSNSGPEMKNQKKLPSFWLNDYIIGHNCISHFAGALGTKKDPVLIQSRESLLSLDVATNYTNVSGVKFKAIFDGQEISPVNPDVVLHRDISKLGNDIFWGNTTVNFILPPTENPTPTLSVKMDTTDISGFEDAHGKGEVEILNLTLKFAPAYGRQLNILVQPVQLYISGYTRSAPDGKGVENALRKLIPAMLPISKEDIYIWTAPVTTFYGGALSMFSSTALLNRIANSLAVSQGFINTTAKVGGWLSGKETAKIDFIIAVLPKGVMGQGITGASLKLRRGVIFVDEDSPAAALHELGHGIGLYTWQEQYDAYPPAGLQVEGLTAFINEKSAAKSIQGFANRFLHFPRKGQSWYEDKYWYDIMGSSSTLMWPIETTFLEFISYFQSALSSKTKSTVYKEAGVPEGYRRIFVSGEMEKIQGPDYYYQLVPGTISVFDITELATGKISVPAEISYWPEDDYKLECYDSSGNIIESATQYFTTVSPYKKYDNTSDWPQESSFCGTFDIPEATETIKVFHGLGWEVWETEPISQVNKSASCALTITSLTSGAQLSDSVEIAWSPEETKGATGTTQYVVMVSADGGDTWVPLGVPIQSNSITIPTDFLPASNNIVFKVISSSGLGPTTSDEIGGLEMENRAPRAVIASPEDGSIGEQGTKWVLKGYG
ncbi:MAG: hypothetical protein PH343_09405, partial [Nitrospira sp.]|nr:hypothetical protein [Nitrospira sp.]